MLTDLGLQTQKQIDSFNKFMGARAEGLMKGNFPGGCVDKAICSNCKHLVMDSLCLCGQQFDCPNCGFKNCTPLQTNYYITSQKFDMNNFGFYSKNDFLKIVDKVIQSNNYDLSTLE